MGMKEMRTAIALWAGLCLSLAAQQTEDKTAGGAVREEPQPQKKEVSDQKTVSGSTVNSKGTDQVQRAAAIKMQEDKIQENQEEDNNPDVGMFVAMANEGWERAATVPMDKSLNRQIVLETTKSPTFRNNMMNSPDGHVRENDGWKLFGWSF